MRAPWNSLGLCASQRPLSQEPTALLTFTWTFFAVGSAVPEHPLFKSNAAHSCYRANNSHT